MNKLAELVRNARRRVGLTQEELAEAIDKSFGYVGQLETGKIGRPKPDTLRALSEALHVPLEALAIATDQLDDDNGEADLGVLLERLAAIPDVDARLQAWQMLPTPVRRSLVVLMQDVLHVAMRQLEE
jgi:transcriptional regulator with XRE-family HTH domain